MLIQHTITFDPSEVILAELVCALAITEYVPPGYGLATLNVVLDSSPIERSSVTWFTSDDTAVATKDYVTASGTLDFEVGELSGIIQVLYVVPLPGAASKQFLVALSYAHAGIVTGQSVGVCTINSPSA